MDDTGPQEQLEDQESRIIEGSRTESGTWLDSDGVIHRTSITSYRGTRTHIRLGISDHSSRFDADNRTECT